MRRRPRSPLLPASAAPAPASARPAASACSCRSSFALPFSRAERLLHQLEDPLLARRAFELLAVAAFVLFPDREREREPAARDLVERIGQHRRVLRLLGELAVERRVRRELDRERVSLEIGRTRLAEDGRDRDRPLRDGGHDRTGPRLLELLELDVRWRCGGPRR